MGEIFKKGWIISTLLFFICNLYAKETLILCNDNLVNPRAEKEMQKIGNELREKTGISVYLCAKKSIGGSGIKNFEKSMAKNIKVPFVLLTLAVDEQKVDIMTSLKTKEMVDVDAILSPFSGTIIPILTERKGEDKYSAAMLNGYADIADRIAKKMGIKLDSSIGNTNRVLINILRVIIYGSFLYFVVMYIRRKYFKKRENGKK